MKQDKDYWKKRCELAEDCIKAEPGNATEWAIAKWESFIKHSSTFPWFDAAPIPIKIQKQSSTSFILLAIPVGIIIAYIFNHC